MLFKLIFHISACNVNLIFIILVYVMLDFIRLIIFFVAKDREALYYTVTKSRPEVDCGSDHELLIAKFRLKLKKVGKTTRPFRYDLNQNPL